MVRQSSKRFLIVVALCVALVAVFVWVARPNSWERALTREGINLVEHAQASLGRGTPFEREFRSVSDGFSRDPDAAAAP